MTKLIVNIGETANDRNADSLRTAFQKINDNFTELYTELGLANDVNLNLGAFEFNGSTMTTTDSTTIAIDQAVTITSDLTVSGDILPSQNLSSTLGSPSNKFHSIYVGTGSVYLGDAKLSFEGGKVKSTVGFDLTDSVGVVNGTVSYADVTNKPTFTASNGLTATTDVNGNVNVGFSGILYVGSQTQYGFEEIVDESGPSPVYSSRLSLPLTTEFLGGDISLTSWGSGLNINTRNPDPFTDYTWSFRYDGTLIAPSTIAFGDGNRTNINQVNNNFVITTNTGPGDPYSWTFDEFGNLTLPGGAVIDTYGDGAGGSTYLWSAPGEVIAVRSMIDENAFGGGIDVRPDGSVDIIAQNISSASWRFNENGSLTLPNTATMLSGSPDSFAIYANPNAETVIGMTSQQGNEYVTLGTSAGLWQFDAKGTLSTPLLLPKTFTAVLNPAHYVGEGTLVLEGPAWEYTVQFQVNPNGTVQTMIDNIPWVSNPGYVNGLVFEFVEADHGIPGYTFSLTLTDVQNPGPMMYTANIAVNPSPEYPSTVKSLGAVKLTADTQSLVFGTDGSLTVPNTLYVYNGLDGAIVGTNGVIIKAKNANPLGLEWSLDGQENIFINDPQLNTDTASVQFGLNGVNIEVNSLTGGGSWTFGPDGNIRYPGDVTQSHQDATTCAPGVDTVIYTSTGQLQHAIKLFVMVEGFTEGGGVSWDTQACDIIAVKGYNNNIVHVTTYGVTYTGAGAIATFDGQWNPTTTRIEITCRPTGSINSVVASVHAIEMSSND
jgi:hypothetical protein